MLTDSCQKIENGFLSLSGKSTGVRGVAKQIVASLTGGEADVSFCPIDDTAKKLVCETLGKEYVENPEGFIIHVADTVTVYADTEPAKLFAAAALQDKYENGKISRGVWWSYPAVPHRSLRVFLPPKKDLDYFYRLLDMLVHLGYNGILLEICGAMEFKRHPEINRAWIDYCASANESADKYKLVGRSYYRVKNSVHTYNAGGEVYSQAEIKEIVQYCADRFIEIVPEVPSLTHSEYLCVCYPQLRECDDEPFAATACPSNPKLNELVFDLYDEVIDVFGCKSLHIGHDEWWVMNVCDKCKDKDPVDLYVNNVLECYHYLKSKGVKTYMWSDKLHRIVDKTGECHCAARKDVYAVPTQKEPKTIHMMGKDYPLYDIYWFNAPQWVKEQGFHQVIAEMSGCSERLPADITYCNWCYACDPAIADNVYYREGKDMILGNAVPSCINNYKERFAFGTQGISVSCWASTDEHALQQWGTLFELGYGSIICWNHDRTEFDFAQNVAETYHGLYRLRNRDILSAPHLEVTHTVTRDWADGTKYYEKMGVGDTNDLTLGHYLVTYADGTNEQFPVLFSLNISYRGVKTERCISNRNWDYIIDPHLSRPATGCDIRKDGEDMWYTAAFPLRGEVVSCTFVPKKGFEGFVQVKEMQIHA